MFDINQLVRKNVLRLKPYSSARDEFQGQASVYLDANENPYPTGYNRYPDPHQIAVKEKLAAIKQVDQSNIFLGNGSDEVIDLLFRAFCEPGNDNVVIPQPTYGMYAVCAGINNVDIKYINLTNNFDLDVDATLQTCDERTKMIFLCSPNNPAGNLITTTKAETLIQRFTGLVVVDEAYIDFTNQPGLVPLLNQYPNLIVLQTLSKAWGLAGIRMGIGFASTEVIHVLNKIKPPYNISILSQQVALKALDNEVRKNEWVKEIISEREKLIIELKKLPQVIEVFPSDANFLLTRVKDAKDIYRKLTERGVIVRDRSGVVLCDNCLRITVGTSAENEIIIRELSQL